MRRQVGVSSRRSQRWVGGGGPMMMRQVEHNLVNKHAHWSELSYRLEDLVSRFPLPQVVRCVSQLMPGEERHMPVRLDVPMLLCGGRTARKLLARNVVFDKRTGTYSETEDTIVIPEDYDGHFLRLQARTTKDKSVVRSLKDIASDGTEAFVNMTNLTSFLGGQGDERSSVSDKSGQRRVYGCGSVFLVNQMVKGVPKRPGSKKEMNLLRCFDEKGNELLIPINQAGEFVEVEKNPSGSAKLSMQTEELILSKKFPGVARYVYGGSTPRLTPFSRLFTLLDTFEEDSLIGCVLYASHALMVEIPLTSSLAFQVALNRDRVLSMPLPNQALSAIQERRTSFLRDLKFKLKFVHKVSGKNPFSGRGKDDEREDDMPSVTVRTRQYAKEAFMYL